MSALEARRDALRTVRALVERYEFTDAEIHGARDEAARAGLLGRILAMLGSIFVLAGLSLYVALSWDVLNDVARVTITLGSGLAAFLVALLADRAREHRIATPAFLLAALLQPAGLLVALDALFDGGDFRTAALFVAGALALQQGLAFRVRRRSTLLFTTIGFTLWAAGTLLDMLEMEDDLLGIVLGGSTLLLCAGLARTRWAGVAAFWNLVGAIAFFGGLFVLVEDTLVEPVFLLAGCGGVLASTLQRSRTLLVVSTLAILWYLCWAGYQWFGAALGWPILLVLFGVALFTLGGLALRLDRLHIRDAPAR